MLSVLAAIVVVLVGASVAIASYINEINQKITGRVDTQLQTVLTTQEAGKPFYLLLIGVDKDEGRVEDPEYGHKLAGADHEHAASGLDALSFLEILRA